jgi:peroxiredoxin
VISEASRGISCRGALATSGMQRTLFAAAMAVAAPFELKDLSGTTHRLADYRGKVVLVNFWATWCEPCRDEMPAIEKLKERFSGQPFAVLAVNVDEPESRIRKFLSTMPLSFTVLLDPARKLARSWNVRLLPASYIVAPDGTIRFSAAGELDWSMREIADRISSLLPKP